MQKMTKTITIPKSPSPFEVIINGVKHTYEAGATVEVEDYIAEVIERTVFEFIPDPGGISWNDLTDKPFGESATGGDTLTWDGNTEGLESVLLPIGAELFRISDAVPTRADCENGVTVVYNDGSTATLTNCFDVNDLGLLSTIVSVPKDNFNWDGVILPKAGCWAMNMGDRYVTSLTIPGYTGFPGVKRMDEKYMPLLTAPNGTKYKISVSDDGKLTAIAV